MFFPRRRDFFSSNSLLRQQTQSADGLKDQQPQPSDHEVGQIHKRKPSRSSAAKTSLRRVAVEAQRSKDSTRSKTPPTNHGAQPSRAVTAYAVAEQFNLAKVDEILRAQGHEPDPFNTGLYPQVIHIQIPLSSIHRAARTSTKELSPKDVGDVFIFPSGTLVSWSLPEAFTAYFATRTLLPAAEGSHVDEVEFEDLDYIEEPTREHSSIKGDTIILGTKQETSSQADGQNIDSVLTKIAFSSGFARSTKLAVLETKLLDYFNSTRDIPIFLSRGSRLPYSRSFILRKTGQLLSLRAQLNLYSELTDSLPDLFWDSRHELGLEGYYDQVGRALDVGIRIKVLNEKMDYAQEIASVLRERLSEKHGLVLEWTIITLIAVEVGFEILRLWKEGWLQEKKQENESNPS
jgi:required for meiotic nuclear division protein 1